MSILRYAFLFMFSLFVCMGSCCAHNSDNDKNFVEACSREISYKISPASRLKIQIPSGYKKGIVKEVNNAQIIEFVPEKDSFENWTRYICIQRILSPVDVYLWAYFTKNSGHLETKPLLSTYDTKTERDRKAAVLLFDRPGLILSEKGVKPTSLNEITIQKFVEGVDDAFVLEYSVRYDPETTSENEKQKLIQASKEFVGSHFSLCDVNS